MEKPWLIHSSVLLQECLGYLAPVSGAVYVDGTLGMGGHTEAILRASGPEGRVIGFEWDRQAIEIASERLQGFGDRLTIIERNFAELGEGLAEAGVDRVDGILVDIGVSSLQLDKDQRGFSFLRDEPLDMRMDRGRKMTAASLIATASEQELADIIYYYGEERQSRRIAAKLVEARRKEPVRTTGQLAALVAGAIPKRFHPKKIHVATKVFQALRIAVNGELENLARVLEAGERYLRPGGVLCVISFHSLEDRIVKRKFRDSRVLESLTSRPVVPGEEEVKRNPRARSARLRVARKIAESGGRQ